MPGFRVQGSRGRGRGRPWAACARRARGRMLRDAPPGTWHLDPGTLNLARRGLTLLGVLFLALSGTASAQPDPRQMSGIPLPDPQLPAGTISVRVIRGQMSNNVTDHPVELREGDVVVTVRTDADGRATFLTLNPGSTVTAATDLDGVRVESQPFPVPGRGGIRVLLVGASEDAPRADVAAEQGQVSFGAESRIAVELAEETVTVFYFLDVVNSTDVPVESDTPIRIIMPPGAQATSALPESYPGTRVEGPAVTLDGPFAPGVTPLRVAYVLPYTSDVAAITQSLPVDLEALLVIVEKRGAMDVASEQIARSADMNPEGAGDVTYIFGAGPRVPAGVPLMFEITGLPHHSQVPAMLTLALAMVILGAGVWGSAVPATNEKAGEQRRQLEVRRHKLFAGLVRLERQQRGGKIGATKYRSRRADIVLALEGVYRELDDKLAPVVLGSQPRVGKRSPVAGQSGTA